MLQIGTRVHFAFDLPYVGRRSGSGHVVAGGKFPILGETYSVESDGSGDYGVGLKVEVKRTSMTHIAWVEQGQ